MIFCISTSISAEYYYVPRVSYIHTYIYCAEIASHSYVDVHTHMGRSVVWFLEFLLSTPA